ncbi:hypothetical protein BGZ98_001209 [Dissophora globulifera]|nr:hypothetical protein BGZ98_001209 [Dissophora globulifera]
MSSSDRERGLRTPPLSPNHRDEFDKSKPQIERITTTNREAFTAPSSGAKDNKNPQHSPTSPQAMLPGGHQVSRGNNRDANGLDIQPELTSLASSAPQASKHHRPHTTSHAHPHPHVNLPYPPPVSPKRKSTNNPMAQHSRFLDDNTRFDTPRPALAVSASAIATNGSGDMVESNPIAAAPARSPHTAPEHNNSGSANRILSGQRPGDRDRRQVLSLPSNTPQVPFHQHRGFSRIDSRVTPASGVDSDGNDSNDTVINIDTNASQSISTSASSTALDSAQSQEHDYDLMVRHVSQQIFNVSSNIAVLERLVPCLGVRHKDTPELRASLHSVLDTTQDLVKSAHSLLKVLTKYHQPPTASSSSNYSIRVQPKTSKNDLPSSQRMTLASRRRTHQRLTKDLALISKAFQELQRRAVEEERRQSGALLVSGQGINGSRYGSIVGSGYTNISKGNAARNDGVGKGGRSDIVHDRELSVQEEALLREILALDGELVFQESILQEREIEIKKMEEGMGQVLDVMRELGSLVHEQREGVDYLHDNILQTRGRTRLAQQEILKASEHQRHSREKMCYLIMVVSIVAAMVLLALVDI